MGILDRLSPSSQFIEVIEWLDDSPNTLLYRFPVRDQEIKNGAQLIVRESQVAVFVHEGQIADQFAPGRYTIYVCSARPSTANAASRTASDSVGWAWQVRAISSALPANSITLTASAIKSPIA